MSDESYYAILGISETASQDEIERAYRNFTEAYHVLSDSIQRSYYDQQLARRREQDAFSLIPTEPPKAAAAPPLPSHNSLHAYPVTCLRWPSARPQPRAGERGIDWRDFAPVAGILCLFAPFVLMRFVFDRDNNMADYGWFLGLAVVLMVFCFGSLDLESRGIFIVAKVL